jgi:hypothetical protein
MKLSVTWMSSGLPCKVPSSGSAAPADAVGLCDGCPQRLVIIFDNLVVVIGVTVNLIRWTDPFKAICEVFNAICELFKCIKQIADVSRFFELRKSAICLMRLLK